MDRRRLMSLRGFVWIDMGSRRFTWIEPSRRRESQNYFTNFYKRRFAPSLFSSDWVSNQMSVLDWQVDPLFPIEKDED